MGTQHCEIGSHVKMGGLRCRVRRTTYSIVGALILATIVTVAIVTRQASAADDQNPTTRSSRAPELIGSEWLNTTDNHPIRLADRKGKVTLVHFWTLGCINCKHNLPAYNQWYKQFADKDVAIIGVHSPETPYEANIANVRAAVRREGIAYPVLVDSGQKNWNRWNQQFWPAIYLIDKRGNIRYHWEGELEYNGQDGTRKVTEMIESLLNEK